jgi:phage gp46-like protein
MKLRIFWWEKVGAEEFFGGRMWELMRKKLEMGGLL